MTKTKREDELQPGDIIMFLGTPHLIDRIDPPTEATLAIAPDCIGYARSSDGWGITLATPWMRVEVA